MSQPPPPPSSSAPMILRIKRKRGTDVPVDALFLQQALAQAGQSAPASVAPSPGPSRASSISPAPSSTTSPTPTASSSPSPNLVRIVQARADAHALRRVTKRRSSARLPLSPSTHALPTLADADTAVHAQQAAELEQAAQDRFPSVSPSPSPTASRRTSATAHDQAQPVASVFRFAETMSSAPRSRAADQEMRKRVTNLQLLRRMEREQGFAQPAAAEKPPQIEATPPTPRAKETPSPPAPLGPRTIVPGAAMARNRIQERLTSSLPPGVHRIQSPGSPRIIDIVVSEPQEKRRKRRQTPAQAQAQAKVLAPPDRDEVDSLGDVFKQMLIEHLKTKNELIPQDLVADDLHLDRAREVAMPDAEEVSDEDTNSSDSDEGEYVYDIYYSDDTPSRMAAAADGASQVGLLPGAVAGRGPEAHEEGIQSVATLQVPNLTADDWAVLMEPVRYERERERAQEGEDDAWWSSDDDYVDEDYVFSRPGATEGEFGFAAPTSNPPEEDVAIGPAEQRVRLARTQRKRPGLEEWDQGEDEDSNEEDFYRNEYPEHELDEPGDSSGGGGMSSDSDFGY